MGVVQRCLHVFEILTLAVPTQLEARRALVVRCFSALAIGSGEGRSADNALTALPTKVLCSCFMPSSTEELLVIQPSAHPSAGAHFPCVLMTVEKHTIGAQGIHFDTIPTQSPYDVQ